MYTHFGRGFHQEGRLLPRFRELMERLSKRPGWFVPVSVLLDYIRAQRGTVTIQPAERRALERRWLAHKIRYGAA
jgi:predicted TIM-barrel fold metal-dependent hydrolase